MASNFDDIKNGLGFGILFGVLLTMIPWVQTNVISTLLNFLPDTWITSGFCKGAIQTATAGATCTVKYLEYAIFGLIGGIIGAWIDLK